MVVTMVVEVERIAGRLGAIVFGIVEASAGFEPAVEVLHHRGSLKFIAY
jgi:hypothetical protein